MQGRMTNLCVIAAMALTLFTAKVYAQQGNNNQGTNNQGLAVQLGPRPFYLVEGMYPSPLKSRLMSCENGPFHATDFSIGHRRAALQFPEHPEDAYQRAARMGAALVECHVTIPGDGILGCL